MSLLSIGQLLHANDREVPDCEPAVIELGPLESGESSAGIQLLAL